MSKRGAYFYFMLDFIKQHKEKTGVTLSMAEASVQASDPWSSMTDDEKSVYKNKSRDGEPTTSNTVASGKTNKRKKGKRTSQGILVSEIEREQREELKKIENMKRRIEKIFECHPVLTNFPSYPMFIMCGNYFYKNDDGKYAPAEIGAVKFTFKDGIIKRHHSYIAPAEIETGYAFQAKDLSERTHRLPYPPDAMGEKDFFRVHEDIMRFIRDDSDAKKYAIDDGKPMVFTYSEYYSSEAQEDILNSFMKQFSSDGCINIDIYSLNYLYYVLRNQLVAKKRLDSIPNENFVKVLLEHDPYESQGNISCNFHEDRDVTQYCALSRATRLVFILCDHFCISMDIGLKAGKHTATPYNADLSKLASPFRS